MTAAILECEVPVPKAYKKQNLFFEDLSAYERTTHRIPIYFAGDAAAKAFIQERITDILADKGLKAVTMVADVDCL